MKEPGLLKCVLALLLNLTLIYGTAQTSCGVDTVNYTYYKTTQFRAVSINNTSSGNAFAQWYPAPQPITVSGFDFYAWQSNGTNAVVAITCNIYRAGPDSLPTGLPLRTVTLNIDSAFGSGQLPYLKKKAIFPSSVTVNTPYVLTVESSSAVNVSVISNDYLAATPNGRSQWLSSVRIGSNYFRSYNINVGGTAFNADFILQPYVSYTLISDYILPTTTCNEPGTPINFTNKSSQVIFSPFYNLYAFYNIPQFCFMWDYGDTTGIYYNTDGNHTYYNRYSYNVKLKDTLYGWTKGCSDTKTKTLNSIPTPPVIKNDGPHCSGDSLKFYTDTLPNLAYTWIGPKSFNSALPNPVIPLSDTSHNGTYYITAKMGNCTSTTSSTNVLIHQTPQIPAATNDGPKCQGDSVVFTASSPSPGITYQWVGPHGFASTTPGFSFTNPDHKDTGLYVVYVEDANCKSGADSTILYIYPPPVAPVLSTLTGDTLCEGDTLYLVGGSVTGALFDWEGPSGFSSSSTNPFIPNISLGKAGTYKASVIIGSCTSTQDSITIGVNTVPTTSAIVGSDSSTEFLTKTYSVTGSAGSVFYWQVQGGLKVSGDSSNTIQVKWGPNGIGSVKVIEKNVAGCTGTEQKRNVNLKETVKPTPSISVGEFTAGKVKIYPNPATHVLNVDLQMDEPVAVSLQITDITGKVVIPAQPATPSQLYAIQLDGLAKGIYFLKLTADKEEKVMRFVVE